VTRHGKVVLHKAKRNNNLSFSKGKTWNLEDMRALEVVSVSRSSTRSRACCPPPTIQAGHPSYIQRRVVMINLAVADTQPTDFALTMTIRRYQWQTERARDQSHFLSSVVKVYRTYTKSDIPELIGWNPPPSSATIAPPNGGEPAYLSRTDVRNG